jgi:preprotein translocase subunit SecG
MQNVVLVVHLILALMLILIVLMQRSEGGGLGIGGGGGGAGGRAAGTVLTKATWILAGGFLVTSLSLTVIAAQNVKSDSVIERIGGADGTVPTAPAGLDGNLLPPAPTDAPATPPKAE